MSLSWSSPESNTSQRVWFDPSWWKPIPDFHQSHGTDKFLLTWTIVEGSQKLISKCTYQLFHQQDDLTCQDIAPLVLLSLSLAFLEQWVPDKHFLNTIWMVCSEAFLSTLIGRQCWNNANELNDKTPGCVGSIVDLLSKRYIFR